MEDGLRTVMKEYIDQVNDVCLRLLAGLCLKSKADFLCSRKLRWGIEYEINGTKYLLHGAGCRACDGERYLDWNFGYGSRWCGIDRGFSPGRWNITGIRIQNTTTETE